MRIFHVDEPALFCQTCKVADMDVPVSRETERCVDCELDFELWIVGRQEFNRNLRGMLK